MSSSSLNTDDFRIGKIALSIGITTLRVRGNSYSSNHNQLTFFTGTEDSWELLVLHATGRERLDFWH